VDRYVIYTPFTFDDGDHYVCILEKRDGGWFLTDEGHTFMHMSYDMPDFLTGTRERVIQDTLGVHGIECRDGVLSLLTSEELVGHSVFSFIQAISKILNVTKFTRDVVRSAFSEDFAEMMTSLSGSSEIDFQWHDKEHDRECLYPVDCRIEGANRPWLIFAVTSTDKCRAATISCLKMEQFVPEARSIAVFEDQTSVNSKAVAQLTDAVWKPFSSLGGRGRIANYFELEVFAGGNSA